MAKRQHHKSHSAWVAVAVLLGSVNADAVAQSRDGGAIPPEAAAGDGRLIYDAVFFATFAPSNALQIVQRIPAFSLETTDEEVRGFGQAASNVVINGQRPSSKSDPIETILQRIPANRVLRVEVGPGSLFGGEYSGKAQVLNVILVAGTGLAGTLGVSARRDFTGRVLPEGNASALLRRGKSTFNASLTLDNSTTSETGFDRLTTLVDGQTFEFRRKINRLLNPDGAVAASWDFDDGTNKTAHLNGRYGVNRFSLDQANAVDVFGVPTRNDRYTQRVLRRGYELGGDITRPFMAGGLKFIALATRKHRGSRDLSLNRDLDRALLGGFVQDIDNQRDETVGRLVWTRPKLAGWAVEIGVEGALNRLASDVNLRELLADGTTAPIDLPIAHAVVEERRVEAFVTAGRALAPTVRLDLGATYEASRLTVSGDAIARRTLRFLKPTATIDWRPKGGWHAQLSVQRTVAQLQFEDFISSAELGNGRVNGGNADLVPERRWEAALSVEHPILGDGLVKLDASYTLISLLQDRVPTPSGFDAPGNLGTGRQFKASGTVDVPLTRFGIKGGRATLTATLINTSVQDPYTLRRRPFSGTARLGGQATFRQDLGRFAYGVELNYQSPSTFYRLDETDLTGQRGPEASIFAEYRPAKTTTLRFELLNAVDTTNYRDRTFYFPSRANLVPDVLEHRERNRRVIPYLTLKHSFG